jgi:hypothetical protein
MSKTPNPGSVEARDLGCICPVLDNELGNEELTGGMFYITKGCLVHAWKDPRRKLIRPTPRVAVVKPKRHRKFYSYSCKWCGLRTLDNPINFDNHLYHTECMKQKLNARKLVKQR